MGAADLIIVINKSSFLVNGDEYMNHNQAIAIAIARFEARCKLIQEQSNYPDELIGMDMIKEIQVYDFCED